MESRMEKYYKKDLSSFERSKKNSELYKNISKEISDLENLPIPDNSNEIDLDGLKQIIYSRDEYRKAKEEKKPADDEVVESIPIRQSRVYDINVLLENAKNEINRSNEVTNTKKINHNFLTTLEEEKIPYHDDAIELSNMETDKKKEVSEDSLPLDLLVDLKGNDNTIVTDPIVKDEVTMIKKIKDGETFYSGSFNFTKKDFDEEEEEDNSDDTSSTVLKMIFLVFGLILIAVAIYFVLTKYVL